MYELCITPNLFTTLIFVSFFQFESITNHHTALAIHAGKYFYFGAKISGVLGDCDIQ